MSPRDAPIKAVHLWAATCLVLAGMGSMIWVGGRWQGQVDMQLQKMTEQVTWLRSDIASIATQGQVNAATNAVQEEKLNQVRETLKMAPRSTFTRKARTVD